MSTLVIDVRKRLILKCLPEPCKLHIPTSHTIIPSSSTHRLSGLCDQWSWSAGHGRVGPSNDADHDERGSSSGAPDPHAALSQCCWPESLRSVSHVCSAASRDRRTRVLAVHDVALPVQEPARDLVLGGVLHDCDDTLELFRGDFTGAAMPSVRRLPIASSPHTAC